MGLDVSVYRKLTKVDAVFDIDGDPIDPLTRESLDDCFRPYSNPDFPGRCDDLDTQALYTYEDSEFVWSSGYGGYSVWREQLAKLAGYPGIVYERLPGYPPSRVTSSTMGAGEAESGPFYELVWYSDCEGTIGSLVAAKLANDFAMFDEKAKLMDSSFYNGYCSWRAAFEIAADGGAVSFH